MECASPWSAAVQATLATARWARSRLSRISSYIVWRQRQDQKRRDLSETDPLAPRSNRTQLCPVLHDTQDRIACNHPNDVGATILRAGYDGHLVDVCRQQPLEQP